jgi:hypothetical protein
LIVEQVCQLLQLLADLLPVARAHVGKGCQQRGESRGLLLQLRRQRVLHGGLHVGLQRCCWQRLLEWGQLQRAGRAAGLRQGCQQVLAAAGVSHVRHWPMHHRPRLMLLAAACAARGRRRLLLRPGALLQPLLLIVASLFLCHQG